MLQASLQGIAVMMPWWPADVFLLRKAFQTAETHVIVSLFLNCHSTFCTIKNITTCIFREELVWLVKCMVHVLQWCPSILTPKQNCCRVIKWLLLLSVWYLQKFLLNEVHWNLFTRCVSKLKTEGSDFQSLVCMTKNIWRLPWAHNYYNELKSNCGGISHYLCKKVKGCN